LVFGIVLGAALHEGLVDLKGQGPISQGLAYASAADVATALRKLGASDDDSAVLRLEPYAVLAEHRVVTKNPPRLGRSIRTKRSCTTSSRARPRW
jgi:hypothetical protein